MADHFVNGDFAVKLNHVPEEQNRYNLGVFKSRVNRSPRQACFIFDCIITFHQALATTASSMISLCSGLTLGVTAVMVPKLREDKSINYDPSYDSWIASIATIAMIFGSLFCGTLLDVYGRKATHLILGAPFIIGWIIIAFANSPIYILIGRFITGLSTGANKSVTLVYIGEIADPKYRAPALFSPPMTANVGVLFIHIVGYYLDWKTCALVCIAPAVISTISFLFLKESPIWLIAKGRTEEGIEAFRWFRGTNEASEQELRSVSERQTEKQNISMRATVSEMCKLSFIKPMLTLLVLMVCVQFSGVNILSFYAQDIFERAFSGKIDAFILMVATDCTRAIISFIICSIGTFVPRRKAFLISNFGVTVFIFGLVMSFCYMESDSYVWIPVTCLIVYICFSSAIITIGWTFVPEVLPNNARGFGSGINATFSYVSLFALLQFTPDIMNNLGEQALFAFYGISTLVGGSILYFALPETNGKTLQSIEDSYNKINVEPTAA